MSRGGITAALLAELESTRARLFWMADIAFSGGVHYYHTDVGDLDYGGNTYTGVGHLGAVGEISEDSEVSAKTISLVLDGLDATIGTEVRNNNLYGREVAVRLAARNMVTGDLITDPTDPFYAYIDQAIVTSGDGVATVELRCETEMARFRRAPVRYLTDSDLQADYPGDLFFEYLPALQDFNVPWGSGQTADLGRPNGGGISELDRLDNAERDYGEYI